MEVQTGRVAYAHSIQRRCLGHILLVTLSAWDQLSRVPDIIAPAALLNGHYYSLLEADLSAEGSIGCSVLDRCCAGSGMAGH